MGTGGAARQFTAAAKISRCACVEAISSRSSNKAIAFCDKFKTRAAYGSYDELALDKNVDLVYIATPAHTHADLAIKALRHGKAVLVEKPFAVNAAQAISVIDTARECGLFCMEAMWMRFLPAYQSMLSRIGAGEIGDLQLLIADFGIPTVYSEGHHQIDPYGGGAFLDRGVYGLSMAINLLGMPTSVSANADLHNTGYDRQSCATLMFNSGKMAVISCSLTAYSANEAVLCGSTARLRLKEPFIRPEVVGFKNAPFVDLSERASDSTSWKEILLNLRFARTIKARVSSERAVIHTCIGNGYVHEIDEVARCIRNGLLESPLMPWDQTLQTMRVCDEVRRHWLG